MSEEEVDSIYYCIGVRALLLYRESAIEYIMVENGPKHTDCVMKGALEKLKKR